MTDHQDSPLPPELEERFQAVLEERFRFFDDTHPAAPAIRAFAGSCLARQLCLDPDAVPGPSTEAAEPPPKGPALDPVAILQKEMKLPSLPHVVVELQELINSETASARDIAEVISRDVSLSAFLLRMVNSAFYSFPSQIETISRAVTVVGVQQLSTLALGASMMDMFKDIPEGLADMNRFWKHCIGCGLLARALATRLGMENPERFFVAGLLHDIGKLALYTVVPERGEEVLALARATPMPVYLAEREALGFDHARLGGMLLRKWNFPFTIVMAVLNHHDPSKAKEKRNPGIVHLADAMIKAMGLAGGTMFYVPPLDAEIWDEMGLSPEDLAQATKELDEKLDSACSVLLRTE